jgi:hypothetical protein
MTVIPIEILKIEDALRDGFHVLCRVHIMDKEFRMLIDTGASQTIFDIKKTKKISQNIPESNNQRITTLGVDNIESKYVLIDNIRIGDIVIENYKTILLDISDLNNHFKNNYFPEIDGIIGGDILMKYNAIIDYKKRTLTLE